MFVTDMAVYLAEYRGLLKKRYVDCRRFCYSDMKHVATGVVNVPVAGKKRTNAMTRLEKRKALVAATDGPEIDWLKVTGDEAALKYIWSQWQATRSEKPTEGRPPDADIGRTEKLIDGMTGLLAKSVSAMRDAKSRLASDRIKGPDEGEPPPLSRRVGEARRVARQGGYHGGGFRGQEAQAS